MHPELHRARLRSPREQLIAFVPLEARGQVAPADTRTRDADKVRHSKGGVTDAENRKQFRGCQMRVAPSPSA